MVMDLKRLTGCIEKFSPPRLAVPGDYVGIQVGPRDFAAQQRTKIRKCAITCYATPKTIIKAARDGADVMVVYHGLLSYPVRALTGALLDKIRLLIENKIVLYVVHTSWLSAECGVNDTFAEILDLAVAEVFNVELKRKIIPVGRVCTFDKNHEQGTMTNVNNISLSDFIAMVSQRLRTDDVLYVGSLQSLVKRILLLAGELGETNLLKLAKSMDVDTFVTGNISREVAMLSSELGMNYLCVNQDPIESLGMRRLMQLLNIDAPEVGFTFIESELPWKKYASTQIPTEKKESQ
jgi:dinuclear metal center YbgI/SA1388 family protein